MTERKMFYVCQKGSGDYGAYSDKQTAKAARAEVALMYGLSRVAIDWEVKQVPFDSTQESYLGRYGKVIEVK